MADVTKDGEVTIEGQFVGRLDGFRFVQDKSSSPEEAKTLRAASLAALAPEFSLRADRFYNAPDTELDFTEQGGLMWGDQAVGKLVRGDEVLKPRAQAFVDDEAGADAAEKVTRRLQHFIDRKVVTLFEPMLAMQKDEALTGSARGFAFRLIEALGIIPRAEVAEDVKALDQETRGLLRKHGVRFGQFTIFMPLMLKPAPTRLRLVLASLFAGADEFPEAPPPGLVTIPSADGADDDTYRLSGYRRAGARAIRIDMLERLADQLRAQDTRSGFEANPDMLSITGMTLEQFADLMQGLGYKAERSEREKVKHLPAGTSEVEARPTDDKPPLPHPGDEGVSEVAATPDAEGADTPEVHVDHLDGGISSVEAQPGADEGPVPHPGDHGLSEADATPDADGVAAPDPEEPEAEVFYTFTWGGFGRRDRGPRKGGGGKPQGKPRGKGKPRRDDRGGGGKAKNFTAKPPKKEKAIDPDNPFAQALMGLKDKK